MNIIYPEPLNLQRLSRQLGLAYGKHEPWTPLRGILRLSRNKWAALVLVRLYNDETWRFVALREEIKEVSPKILTQTLRELEQCNLIKRYEYDQAPPKVEYTITHEGKWFLNHLGGMLNCVDEES